MLFRQSSGWKELIYFKIVYQSLLSTQQNDRNLVQVDGVLIIISFSSVCCVMFKSSNFYHSLTRRFDSVSLIHLKKSLSLKHDVPESLERKSKQISKLNVSLSLMESSLTPT